MRRAGTGVLLLGAGVGSLGFAAYNLHRLLSPPTEEVWEKHVQPHGPICQVASNLWQVTGTVSKGSPLSRNMAIYRLPSQGASGGELVLHSVVALDGAGMAQLERLGRPAVMIVPSPFHRLDAAVYKKRYPEIRVVCPRAAIPKVGKALPVDAAAEDVLPHQYGIEVVQLTALRVPELGYVLPLGVTEAEPQTEDTKNSGIKNIGQKALLVCDLLVNQKEGPWYMKYLGYVTGGDQPGMSFMFRNFFVTDKQQAKQYWERLASRDDLTAILMAHGQPVIGEPQQISAKLEHVAQQL